MAGQNENPTTEEDKKRVPWALRFNISVTLLKWAALLAPRDVNIIRMVTDMNIPFFMCDHGVDVAINAVVVPASSSDPELLGEIYEKKQQMTTPKQHAIITVLYAHGGAYCLCSSGTHRRLLTYLSLHTGARIVAIDYRRPPEHPHPVCRDDMVKAYLQLIESGTPPKSIVFAGDSAGGGLCVSALVALRDAGRPLPAGAALMSPWVDLTDHTGGTWASNLKSDYFPGDMAEIFARLVVGPDGDPSARNIAASPIFAELSGLPPLLIESGGGEVLLGQISRFAKVAADAGVDVDYKIYKGMVHFFQIFEGMGQPEPNDSLRRVGNFISKVSEPNLITAANRKFLNGTSLDGDIRHHGGIISSGNYFTTRSFVGLAMLSFLSSYSLDCAYDNMARHSDGYVDYHPGYLFTIIFIAAWIVRIYQHFPSKPNYSCNFQMKEAHRKFD